MYQPLPPIVEDLATLEERLRHERNPKRKPRLHLLVLLKSGQVTSRGQAAATLPPAVFEQLKIRLATPTGFASYLDVQQWLREEFGLDVPYKTLHGIVHYQLKAKLKRPRPSHAKKTLPRRRILSSSAHAALGRSQP